MATPGPRTRSRARAESAILQGISTKENPTTTETKTTAPSLAHNMENKSSNTGSTIASEGILRQGSLIPAYNYNDKIDDISLECMMGTPFTIEIKAKQASRIAGIAAVAEKKTGASAVVVQSKDEAVEVKEGVDNIAPKPKAEIKTEIEEDNLLLANVEGLELGKEEEIPAAEQAAVEEEAEEEKEPEEGFLLASALDALSLHKESLSNDSQYEEENEEESDEEFSESEEEALPLHLNGPLRGLPTPQGSHVRFDDNGGEIVSPRRRVFLRGMPEPTGIVTVFNAEEEGVE